MEKRMSDITITLTKEEISILLKLVYTGSFVLKPEDDTEKTIDDLIQKILLVAKVNKAYRGIEYNQEINEYMLTEKAEEAIEEEFEEFVEESFWEELLFRLGQRDLIKEVGEKEYRKMEEKELEERQEEVEEKYREEFEKNGIRNLRLE
jgi:hypothetical protein